MSRLNVQKRPHNGTKVEPAASYQDTALFERHTPTPMDPRPLRCWFIPLVSRTWPASQRSSWVLPVCVSVTQHRSVFVVSIVRARRHRWDCARKPLQFCRAMVMVTALGELDGVVEVEEEDGEEGGRFPGETAGGGSEAAPLFVLL